MCNLEDKSTPISYDDFFQEQTHHFHIGTSVIRLFKWNQLSFSSFEMNQPFPVPGNDVS